MNIFITGASSGIGEYVSYEYAKSGNHLALCARRKEKLENIANKCREMGAQVTTYSVDVGDQHSTKESISTYSPILSFFFFPAMKILHKKKTRNNLAFYIEIDK